MAGARRVAGLLVAFLVTGLVGAGSALWWDAAEQHGGVLRLSWRVRSVRIEECRPLTAEEAARLPVHMRPSEICEGAVRPYRLEVAIDDSVWLERTIAPSGSRGDQPLYVFEEVPLPSGRYEVAVRFERSGGDDDAAATPARLRLEQEVLVEPRTVTLVAYDPDARELQIRGARAP